MQDIASSSQLEQKRERPLAPFRFTISTMHCMTVSLARNCGGEELATRMLKEAGFPNVDLVHLTHDMMTSAISFVAKCDFPMSNRVRRDAGRVCVDIAPSPNRLDSFKFGTHGDTKRENNDSNRTVQKATVLCHSAGRIVVGMADHGLFISHRSSWIPGGVCRRDLSLDASIGRVPDPTPTAFRLSSST